VLRGSADLLPGVCLALDVMVPEARTSTMLPLSSPEGNLTSGGFRRHVMGLPAYAGLDLGNVKQVHGPLSLFLLSPQ
jgi:hypothetical protein